MTQPHNTLPHNIPLSPDQQRAAGIEHPMPYAMASRVVFSELDSLKHVNNRAYLAWFENIRVAYFHHFSVSQFRRRDPRMVLRTVSVDYRQEMKIGDEYIVGVRVTEMRNSSFTMEHAVWCGGEMRTHCVGVMVMMMPDDSGTMRIPDDMRAEFHSRDGARQV